MCGIFGIVGKSPAAPMVLAGLTKLEYRGYDSWGIVVKHKDHLVVEKHVGKIATPTLKLPLSSLGLGHTRWATHGGVTVANAHPFLDCSQNLALVHNGIIENYQQLKQQLSASHKFSSQTDTEILLHLIEEYRRRLDLPTAVRQAFAKTTGLNAILVIEAATNTLVAAKSGSPLVIGFAKGYHLIASDLWSLLDHTRQVAFLEDNHMAVITKDKVNFYHLDSGQEAFFTPQTIDWQQQLATRGNFPHFMIKEISEQPNVLSKIIAEKDADIKKLSLLIKKSQGTFLAACGTAAYAALAGQYLFSRLAHYHINPAIGSEFIYHANFLTPQSLLIALSQSGETIDTIESVKLAKAQHAHTIAVVNVPGSTLYRLADEKILLSAGPEKAVASTKAFTAKIALLLLTASYLAGRLKPAQAELKLAAQAIRQFLSASYRKKLNRLAGQLYRHQHIFVVGRGQSYPAALEGALKIKEISYIHAEGLAGGELKHGPIALIETGVPCLIIAPPDETYNDVLSGAMELKARGGFIIGISSQSNPVFDEYLKVPDCGNATIIPNVAIFQILAYELALVRGLDPDKPRNLAKSVTVK
ncbi:MAG: glutamine--fructose-6-phosphate transaminase (isomerizing) [Candidatus Chisholmbacteria bacterium]|nr:glutamine--fructose-6-phosphate transaminase (isomerizing) [Candidatus Chisholmbacteria bacterium]